jgi:hypothetical protein
MWIGEIRLVVVTKNVSHAGTDSLVNAVLLRDDNPLVTLRLDRRRVDDLERGSTNDFRFLNLPRLNDHTPELPPSVLQFPMPYPPSGIEFSNGLPGHLKFRLTIGGDDMWIKDRVDLFINQFQFTSEAQDWVLDQGWSAIGSWGQDVKMSTDFWEGSDKWILGV